MGFHGCCLSCFSEKSCQQERKVRLVEGQIVLTARGCFRRRFRLQTSSSFLKTPRGSWVHFKEQFSDGRPEFVSVLSTGRAYECFDLLQTLKILNTARQSHLLTEFHLSFVSAVEPGAVIIKIMRQNSQCVTDTDTDAHSSVLCSLRLVYLKLTDTDEKEQNHLKSRRKFGQELKPDDWWRSLNKETNSCWSHQHLLRVNRVVPDCWRWCSTSHTGREAESRPEWRTSPWCPECSAERRPTWLQRERETMWCFNMRKCYTTGLNQQNQLFYAKVGSFPNLRHNPNTGINVSWVCFCEGEFCFGSHWWSGSV